MADKRQAHLKDQMKNKERCFVFATFSQQDAAFQYLGIDPNTIPNLIIGALQTPMQFTKMY